MVVLRVLEYQVMKLLSLMLPCCCLYVFLSFYSLSQEPESSALRYRFQNFSYFLMFVLSLTLFAIVRFLRLSIEVKQLKQTRVSLLCRLSCQEWNYSRMCFVTPGRASMMHR